MVLEVSAEQIKVIGEVLADERQPLARRFRALFTLRNVNSGDCVDLIGAVLRRDSSALLKHECAYCLGQMGQPTANPILAEVLANAAEHPMVRHEAGEALGAIGSLDSVDVLKVSPERRLFTFCKLQLCSQKVLQRLVPDGNKSNKKLIETKS